MVGFVWEKSEYYKAGFRVGDILVAVDGRPLNSMEDYKQFQSRHIKNQFYTFTVNDRNGSRRIIKSRW
jgi:membrane-associated protease RseP (regulator of RpoE activity)